MLFEYHMLSLIAANVYLRDVKLLPNQSANHLQSGMYYSIPNCFPYLLLTFQMDTLKSTRRNQFSEPEQPAGRWYLLRHINFILKCIAQHAFVAECQIYVGMLRIEYYESVRNEVFSFHLTSHAGRSCDCVFFSWQILSF